MKKYELRKAPLWAFLLKLFIAMKLVILLLCTSVLSALATDSYSQTTKLSLSMNNVTIGDVLKTIEDKSEFRFFYTEKVATDKKVSVDLEKSTISQVLDEIFKDTGISYRVVGRQIVLYSDSSSKEMYEFGQTKEVRGKVTNEAGEPIPGATVAIKGTTSGTITGADGTYLLSKVPDSAVLLFTFVGMKTQEVTVAGKSQIDVKLAEETIGIDEVVAVGYGTQKKRDMIGSIASLNADEVKKIAPVSVESTIQGMAAGVQVNSGSGIPGAPQQIKIRGVGSISSGTDPLWIVDGIPIVSGPMDASYNGEVNQSVLAMINPNDIESIQILKDAAATSIYGSRGSNGVILVTTKSGKKGQTKVDFDVKSGISNWEKTNIGYAGGKDYISIMDMAMNNIGAGQYSVENAIKQLDGATEAMTRDEALNTNTNWVDAISRTGSFYEANLSVSQGSEKGNSYLSLKYRKDNSNLKFNSLESYSANINLNYNLFKNFDLGYRLMASFTDNDRVKSGDGKQGAGGWGQVNSNSLPWMKIYDTSGFNGYWNSRASVNALASVDPINSQSNLKTINVLSGLNATWKLPVQGLSLKGEFGLNYVANRGRSWRSGALLINGAVAQETKYETTTANYNAYFNYDVPLPKIHTLNVVAGIENTRQISQYMGLKGESLVGKFPEVGTPNVLSGSSTLGGESYLRGFFGRANYKLADKYLAGVSVRRDGISKFTADNRWATFLSGSLGWIISEEKFFHFKPVSLLKLRGSYGQTGNTNIPSGVTSDRWGINSGSSTLASTNNTYLGSIGNSDIKWETTNSLDAGIDYGFYGNRINGSLAYYQKKVSDMLLAVTLPPSAGIWEAQNYCWQNIGDMKNEGFEFNVNAVVYNKHDFTFNLGFNISTNSNKVLSLDPTSDANHVGILQSAEEGIIRTITKSGLSWGTYYMAEYAGVDAQKGIPLIYEVKKLDDGSTEHTGNIIPATNENMSNNRMMLKGKTALPKLLGGFNANFTYKRFDLSMVWSFVTGNYIYNRLLQSSMTPNQGMLVLNKKLLTESWTKPGDQAYWPQVTAANLYKYDNAGNPTTTGVSYGSDNNTPSSQYLEKGDYLKLRNITLGYTIPSDLTNRCKINTARIYLSASNLFTITKFSGYSPEIGIDQATGGCYSVFTSMPSSRTFMFGLSINF